MLLHRPLKPVPETAAPGLDLPDAIFLLTDGQFTDKGKKAPIAWVIAAEPHVMIKLKRIFALLLLVMATKLLFDLLRDGR